MELTQLKGEVPDGGLQERAAPAAEDWWAEKGEGSLVSWGLCKPLGVLRVCGRYKDEETKHRARWELCQVCKSQD